MKNLVVFCKYPTTEIEHIELIDQMINFLIFNHNETLISI